MFICISMTIRQALNHFKEGDFDGHIRIVLRRGNPIFSLGSQRLCLKKHAISSFRREEGHMQFSIPNLPLWYV